MSVLDAHEGSGSHCLSAHKLGAIIAKTNVTIIIVIIIVSIVITCAAITLCLSAMSVHFGQRQSLHRQYLL